MAQVGGEVAKATWLAHWIEPAVVTAATAIVDKLLQTARQALVALIGIALLLVLADDSGLVPRALAFVGVLIALIPLFLYAQRDGVLLRLATSPYSPKSAAPVHASASTTMKFYREALGLTEEENLALREVRFI